MAPKGVHIRRSAATGMRYQTAAEAMAVWTNLRMVNSVLKTGCACPTLVVLTRGTERFVNLVVKILINYKGERGTCDCLLYK